MKYLKKFNEELKPGTYFSAARKLAKIDAGRSAKLKEWGQKMETREELQKWKESLQVHSPFGIFKITVKNPKTGKNFTADFAIDLNFDELAFEDSYEYEKEKSEGDILDLNIPFFIGIIPTSEETMNLCNEIMPEAEFGNGFYWGMCLSLGFDIIGGKVQFKKFELDSYDSGLSGEVSLADRASAGKFKTLLVNIFSNPNFNYPSGYTDAASIYEKLEQVILIRQSFSSDWGFALEHVAEFIKTISPNTLYKAI